MLSPASPPRTPKSSGRQKTNENLGSNVPVAPWSRSKIDRFAGPGSFYSPVQEKKASKQSTPRKTPSKPELPATHERYATVAERALNGITKASTPSATYSSTTDRFKLPGGVHEVRATPGVGAYDIKPTEDKVRGAVRLQAAIRRRLSRGIFSQIEANAREVPSPGKYHPCAESKAGHATFSMDESPRFEGPQSMYGRDATPAVGEYDPEHASHVIGGGAKSAFRGHAERFEGHNSIYAGEKVPGVGEYESAGARMNDERPSSLLPSASYRGKAKGAGHTDRFDGHDSFYTSSSAPGVGSYNTTEGYPPASGKMNASYTSTTDRFKLAGGVYDVPATPGVGTYEVKVTEAKIRGAVKLQQAVRRRLSRGIFAQIEAHSREVSTMALCNSIERSHRLDCVVTGAITWKIYSHD